MRRLLALIVSDYRIHYGERGDTRTKCRALFLPRAISNPSIHATILIRLAYATPQWMIAFWRNVLLTKQTIDIGRNIEIGPGLNLPHPAGLTLASGTQIGANCTMFHNVTLGARAGHQRDLGAERSGQVGVGRLCPTIGDGVVIYTGAIIVGPVTVGDGAIIGARAWVDRDVAPGAIVSAGRQQTAIQAT
ncbi:MAG: serine O-acetyltransferase [Solirubrobacteraceae bacterium]